VPCGTGRFLSIDVFFLWHSPQRAWHLASSASRRAFDQLQIRCETLAFGSLWSISRSFVEPQRLHGPFALSQARRRFSLLSR